MELLGWFGSILLAFCGFPQAIKSYKEKHSDGIAPMFLWMWGIGEIAVLVYIFPEQQWPLIANYTANLVFVAIIAWYKVYPTRNTQKMPINQ